MEAEQTDWAPLRAHPKTTVRVPVQKATVPVPARSCYSAATGLTAYFTVSPSRALLLPHTTQADAIHVSIRDAVEMMIPPPAVLDFFHFTGASSNTIKLV